MTNTCETGKICLVQKSDAYWKVTFDLPPLNIFGPANLPQLESVVSRLESDDRVKVVVFDSAVDGFFLTHYDFLAKPEESARFPLGRTGLQALPDMLARLSRASVVSIASIRGRATGVGSELALASDLRFASRERAILSQWEVGAALVPGGGPMARLPRLMGRGRALEVLLGADDIDGDLAQLYGYVNRSLPDNQLDAFVDALATRIASFDKRGFVLCSNKVFTSQETSRIDSDSMLELSASLQKQLRSGPDATTEEASLRSRHKRSEASYQSLSMTGSRRVLDTVLLFGVWSRSTTGFVLAPLFRL